MTVSGSLAWVELCNTCLREPLVPWNKQTKNDNATPLAVTFLMSVPPYSKTLYHRLELLTDSFKLCTWLLVLLCSPPYKQQIIYSEFFHNFPLTLHEPLSTRSQYSMGKHCPGKSLSFHSQGNTSDPSPNTLAAAPASDFLLKAVLLMHTVCCLKMEPS